MLRESTPAVPVLASTNDTAFRELRVPLSWAVQVVPPSVVRRMVPEPPTAVPVLASPHDTPYREKEIVSYWRVHVVPPSEVLRVSPPRSTLPPSAPPVMLTTT